MIKILTVCGNGIGSSLMLKMKIEEIASENNIDVFVESIDSNAAPGKDCDVYITVKEIADLLPKDKNIIIVRSYVNKKKISEDVLEKLMEMKK